MITLTASSAHFGLRQLENRRMAHPSDSKYSVFALSCAIFLGWLWCQFPPSTSIAIFEDGIAKSMLYLSMAYPGSVTIPLSINFEYNTSSYSLILLFVCLVFAILHRRSCVCVLKASVDRPTALLRNFSSYVRVLIFNDAASENERVGIPYSFNHLHAVHIVQLKRRAISALDFLSSIYNRCNSSQVGFNGLGLPGGLRSIPYIANHRPIVVIPTPSFVAIWGVVKRSLQYMLRKISALGSCMYLPIQPICTPNGTLSIVPIEGARYARD